MITDEMVAAGLQHYSEGGCSGLDAYEREEVVRNILEAALSISPSPVDGGEPTPSTHVKELTDEQRGLGIGMAIAAAMIMRIWGNFTYATEILNSAGLETLEKLKASGVEQFDIDALTPILATEGK